MNARTPRHLLLTVLALVATLPAAAQTDYHEVEPNETKQEATFADCMRALDWVSGWPTGTPPEDDRDVFRIRVCPAPPAIYEHTLDLDHFTFVPEYFPMIRGRSQTAGQIDLTSDEMAQRAVGPVPEERFVQWYGFGKAEELYYDLGETYSFRTGHESFLRTEVVTPTPIPGIFDPGMITISSLGAGHNSNTEIWVYDEELNAIPGYGNDDKIVLLQEQAELVRPYAPGLYYIAISDVGLANAEPSPPDDDFREGVVLDFPDMILNGSAATGVDVSFTVSDGMHTQYLPAVKAEMFEVLWYVMQVGVSDGVWAFCPGDATGMQCPCGNWSAPFTGQGCANTTRRGGILIASGTTSIAASDFSIHARGLPPDQFTLLFLSLTTSNTQLPASPIGGGLSCLGGSTLRLGLRPTGAAGESNWLNLTSGIPNLMDYHFGTFQVAYRDPTNGCGGFNYTNALAVDFDL